MTGKAKAFRIEQERNAHPPKPKSPRRPRRDDPVDTSQPGVSATDRKAGQGDTGSRNVSKRAGRKGGVVLETSSTDRPSRKSTRRSTGHIKPTAGLQLKAAAKATSPEARAARAKAKR